MNIVEDGDWRQREREAFPQIYVNETPKSFERFNTEIPQEVHEVPEIELSVYSEKFEKQILSKISEEDSTKPTENSSLSMHK